MTDEEKPSRPFCSNCPYYQLEPSVGELHGTCHRFAPRPGQPGEFGMINWPHVSDNDWCAEHPLVELSKNASMSKAITGPMMAQMLKQFEDSLHRE